MGPGTRGRLEISQEFGQTGTGPGCFNDAAGLGVDGAGNILVADSKNHRIALFDKTGRWDKLFEISLTVFHDGLAHLGS